MAYKWDFIGDLPGNWKDLASTELPGLASNWREQEAWLKQTDEYRDFMGRLRREIAIETGIIERLYSIDRGITRLLIEHGIDESLIRNNAAGRPAAEIVSLIRDQGRAVDSLFDFVSGNRSLSTGYIKELHAMLTANQGFTEALVRSTGQIIQVELLRGEYKRQPNNPEREDGTVFEYCPPEHVAAEMDMLVKLHLEHRAAGVPPEIEAAWLHHRFTQIHPFQDGNGRVARLLASLVFIQAHWFPLTIRDDDRSRYIGALEDADQGDLAQLITLFAEREKQAFLGALSFSGISSSDARLVDPIIASVRARFEKTKEEEASQRKTKAEHLANLLRDVGRKSFESVEQKLQQEISAIEPGLSVRVSEADNGDTERSHYHSIPINETAKRLGYFANRQSHSSWVQLAIALPATRVEILLSFHGLGYTNQGLYVASACAYRRDREDAGPSLIAQIEPLADLPFSFSYEDDETIAIESFRDWLSKAIALGIAYWERAV